MITDASRRSIDPRKLSPTAPPAMRVLGGGATPLAPLPSATLPDPSSSQRHSPCNRSARPRRCRRRTGRAAGRERSSFSARPHAVPFRPRYGLASPERRRRGHSERVVVSQAGATARAPSCYRPRSSRAPMIRGSKCKTPCPATRRACARPHAAPSASSARKSWSSRRPRVRADP